MTRSALPDPVHPDTTVFDRAESGRHRHGVRRHPAAMVTAAIAVGSVALAGFAAVGATAGPDTGRAQASLTGAAPLAAEGALSSVQDTAIEQTDELLRLDTIADEQAALTISQSSAATGAKAAEKAAAKIAADRKAEKEAAEAAAAEAAAAEEAAAEQAAAEQAAAESAAAEEAAAQEQTTQAAPQQETQAASRSAEREPAPEPEPAPAPAPSGDPRSIARSMLSSYGWGQDQFGCLDSLWMKESGWNASAMNPSSGAYGIPQSLPGSKMASAGSDWQSNPATQIRWGLGYIDGRYGSPCAAWAHSQAVNWY